MKKLLLWAQLLIFTATLSQAQTTSTPLSMNGRLKLVGKQLSNQCGNPVQLRGMSTHAVQAHSDCYTPASLEVLAKDWGSDLIRLAVYTADIGVTKGYINGDKAQWDSWIDGMVTLAEQKGIYVIIDWHILSDGNPNTYVSQAKTFFGNMSKKYKNKRHVLYEICNEPNGGVNWGQIKSYADQIIPIIRTNDPEGIILVGTPDWSSKPADAASSPVANPYNVMYTFHFYAASHYDYNYLKDALGKVPVFATEWGVSDASGTGGYDPTGANNWLAVLNGSNNGSVKVSWANWSFVDKAEAASALSTGACLQQNWTNRTTAGNYIYNILKSGDNFTQCAGAADDDKDGVPNSEDKCANTPSGTFVDATGCPALQGDADKDGVIDAKDLCANTPSGTPVTAFGCAYDLNFVSNACIGFNNYQGYARHDFAVDSLVNLEYWNRPRENSPVYRAGTSGGELVVNVTNADPLYKTMGFSFGFNPDSTLIPLDVRPFPTVSMKVNFQPTGNYSATSVLLDIQLEDANGNSLTSSSLKKLHRIEVTPLNAWKTVTADFKGGFRESYDKVECPTTQPCYFSTFDFSKLTKVKLVVNPGAGETWSKPAFTGVWKVDDFSVGYDATNTTACTSIRDDDKDGVKQELDKCPNTPANSTVNSVGCAPSQLDDDKDGVPNSADQCPNTPKNVAVNANGCTIVASVSNDMVSGALKIYPVPAKEYFVVEQNSLGYTKATLMDVSGNEIKSMALVTGREEMSLENVAKGIYMVHLSGAEKSGYVRIVVQ